MTEQAGLLIAQGLECDLSDGERACRISLPYLNAPAGGRIALLGESGSGKSTVLTMLALAIAPTRAARFSIGGDDIDPLWQRRDEGALSKLRAGRIAYIPQRDGLIEFLSVRDNLYFSARIAGRKLGSEATEILAALRLGGLQSAMPSQLSGGQRQRASVACALVRRPTLILADEPTASLDTDNAANVLNVLCDFSASMNAVLVLSTHQPDLVRRYGFTPLFARQERAPNGHLLSRFEGEA